MEELNLSSSLSSSQELPRPVGNFYLRFPDYTSFFNASDEAGLVREDVVEWETVTVTETVQTPEGEETIEKEIQEPKTKEKNLISSSFGHSFDIIGKIVKASGSLEEASGSLETVTLEGFHVNYSGILPVQFESAHIEIPANPYRKLNGAMPLTSEESGSILDEP